MKLLLTGLIALSMAGYSHADGFGTGLGFGIGMAMANKVFSGGQPRQRERVVEHRTVVGIR
jgi:transketolase